MTESLSKKALLEGLPTSRFGRNLFFFESLDSTNACARTLAEAEAAEGTVVWSEFQTAGKGRLGRPWVSEASRNLMCSCILRHVHSDDRPFLSYYLAEATAKAIESVTDLEVVSRWPNDLLVGDKKCSGLLIETGQSDEGPFVVAGIGINVNQTRFGPDLEKSATSLALASGRRIDRRLLFHGLLGAVESVFDGKGGKIDAHVLLSWKGRCRTFGQRITVTRGSERLSGTAQSLSPDGGLVLTTDSGQKVVHAGDVTVEK